MAARRALDGWSRLVGWLKVALPLTALGLLSTLFLISNRIDPDRGTFGDFESRLREPRLTGPIYSTVTDSGSALTIIAAEARPATVGGAPSTAADVTARMTAPDGKRTDLRAAKAELDPATDLLHLTGDVRIDDPNGYRIVTERLDAELSRNAFSSPGPVTATGPTGVITAATMTLKPDPEDEKSYLLVFNGSVKLLYQPK